MEKAIIGRKVGMTQIFDENGKVIPVTVIEAGPCVVTQLKTIAKEGYNGVQLGFADVPERKLTNPEKGHLKKAGSFFKKHLKEFKLEGQSEMTLGQELRADVFSNGDRVDVTGTSKGKGFAGAIKRWGSAGGRTSHGGGPVHRSPGSLGANSSPSKIFPGKHQAGQLGAEQVTVQNLDVVKVDAEKNLLAVRGAIPGPRHGIVYIKNTTKKF